jgi:acetolactate synthase-1/2/3 large subunit
MFPGLTAVDVADIGSLSGALRIAVGRDGPAVVAVDCSPDEIPPFAAFLTTEGTPHVTAGA